MTAGSPFDRQAPCPNCGAPMTFKFAGARAQVCKYCKFLVARTDRGLVRMGQVADLAEIPSPLAMGVTGTWERRRFEVDGRVQLDRVAAASAPWQEFFLRMLDNDDGVWIAFAQGRWYWTKEVQPTPPLPPLGTLRPGVPIQLPHAGQVTIAEVGRRRVTSLEGELPKVALPEAVTPYADFGGPGGVFGTLDYGDGQSIPPTLYLGRQFDPATFKLDSGQQLDAPQAEVSACTCPNCGGSLPLVAPGTTERIVCKYCGTVSDVKSGGALSALGQAPRPPMEPFIPLGAEGELRGRKVIMIGFVIRGTWVEGGHYTWREYLLYAGPSEGYIWLTEEDNHWQLVTPIPPGEAQIAGNLHYAGKQYTFKQSVQAAVEYVVGEFYWKVAVGESVEAIEFKGPDGNVSVEKDQNEVNMSFCQEINPQEIGHAFKIAPPPSASMFSEVGEGGAPSSTVRTLIWVAIIIVIILFLVAADCGSGSSSGGSSGGVYVSPGFGGK